MPRVILHNLSLPYTNQSSGLFDFDQLGLMFADAGDIVVTRRPIPKVLLEYLQPYIPVPGISFISAPHPIPEEPFAIFHDETVKQEVKKAMRGREFHLECFMPTAAESVWAQELGVSHSIDSEQADRFGTKSAFRTLARQAGIPIPKGFEHVFDPFHVALQAGLLFLSGFSEVVIKQDNGVAGLASRRLSRRTFLTQMAHWESLLPTRGNVAGNATFVIEGWHRSSMSPSIQVEITDTEVRVLSLHIQLFYPNQMSYRGCLSHQWLPTDVRDKLEQQAIFFARYLQTRGYRGHLGLNAVVTSQGLLWVELNPRRVTSSSAHRLANRLLPNAHYLSVELPIGKRHDTPENVFTKLTPLLFSPTRQEGAIPYGFELLASKGIVRLMMVAPSKMDLRRLLEKVSRELKQKIPTPSPLLVEKF
jgi:hypothetical protein